MKGLFIIAPLAFLLTACGGCCRNTDVNLVQYRQVNTAPIVVRPVYDPVIVPNYYNPVLAPAYYDPVMVVDDNPLDVLSTTVEYY